jgi:hypothetical protein
MSSLCFPTSNTSTTIITRDDKLSEIEREFVINYGKECVRNNANVDTTNLHKAYRTKFPQWQRLGRKLKSCWDNYKDGLAYKTFLASLKK